jgi:hypothetical protein
MRDDRRELNKQIETVLWAGLFMLALYLYVQLHSFFSSVGLAHPISDKLLGGFTKNSTLLTSHWTLKMFAGACIAMYGIGNRGVKSVTLKPISVIIDLIIALVLYVGGTFILTSSEWLLGRAGISEISIFYIIFTVAGALYIIKGTQGINRLLNVTPGEDEFNVENETFPQEERLLENKYSVNLPTRYTYKGKIRKGWLNISAPFRGTLVMGIAGSGKSFGIINSIIRQHMAKGFAMYVYDYKFPDLSLVTFNAMVKHRKKLHKNTRFYCINFEYPQKSHRCNPLHPMYLTNMERAGQTAEAIMLNLNKNWIDKKGDFFVTSPIVYITALIWYLRNYKDGTFCTVPHLVELVNKGHRKLFPILASYEDLENYMAPFISAFEGGAMDQLEGQMASAQMGLAKLSSPGLYWAMSGNDFTLDINNPDAPKVLCLGNTSDVDDVYGAALGLYNFRVLELTNRQKQHQSSIIVDECPRFISRDWLKSSTPAVRIGWP